MSQGAIESVKNISKSSRWAVRECERTGAVVNGESKRLVLGDTLYLIRYLTLSAAEFAAGPAQSGILLQQESFSILMNISCPGSWELPEYMAGMAEPRKDPGRLMEPPVLELRSKHWCKRAMMQVVLVVTFIAILTVNLILIVMQEPHCLNTSILDCSVTFTVDKDVWVHGLEVPSQVTDVPEELTAGKTKITVIAICIIIANIRVIFIVLVTDGDDGGGSGGLANHHLLRQRIQRASLCPPSRQRGHNLVFP